MTTIQGGPGLDEAPLEEERQETALVPTPLGGVVAPSDETASNAVAAREKASIEARFLMALHRPRNVDGARLRILAACKRPLFAEVARYSKPVGRASVTGLSVRFAEEAGRQWGNLSVTAMCVFDNEEARIFRVTGVDLETNWTSEVDVVVEKTHERRQVKPGDEVLSKRQNSRGEWTYRLRADADALLVKANAQISKAKRNVILDLIPGDIQEEAEQQILQTVAARTKDDPEGEKKRILAAFYSVGVTPEQVVEFVGKPLEQLNPAEIDFLRTVFRAVKDGEITWDGAMKEKAERDGATVGKPAAKKGKSLREKVVGDATPPARSDDDDRLDREMAGQ